MPLVYLITGANRGIGLEATRVLAARPDTVVYAGARTISAADALHALARERPSVKPVQLDATSGEDIAAVVAQIKREEGKVDVVLANAGVVLDYEPIATAPLDNLRQHFEINTVGPVLLYQLVFPVLAKGGVFGVVSSIAGWMSVDVGVSITSYGTSKAAVNFIVARIGYENKDVVSVAIHPGAVSTDMGQAAAAGLGEAAAKLPPPITPQESGAGVVAQLDEALEKKVSGRFVDWKGEKLPW